MAGNAIHRDISAALLNDAVAGGESETGTVPFLFGGKERFKYVLKNIRRDPSSSVRHGQSNVLTRRHFVDC